MKFAESTVLEIIGGGGRLNSPPTFIHEIEDEYYFLFECKKNKGLRKEFYCKMYPIKENSVTMNNSEKVQFLFSLSEIEKGTICQFSKFVSQSFNIRESHM